MSNIKNIAVFFVLISLKDVVLGTNYCQTDLCPSCAKHIGCESNANFGTNCPPERALVPMTAALKAYLLKMHNHIRSSIANGNIPGYSTANRMIEMTWDDELAKLAEYNAKTCIYHYDECRNTDNFKYAGQNIAIVLSNPNHSETIKAVEYLFGFWFEEYKDCNMTFIKKFRPSDTEKQIGHFTQIVTAGANKVGCALTNFRNVYQIFYFVCNYSLTNIKNRPIYTTGAPCSACTTGCSKTYPGLCSSSEVITLYEMGLYQHQQNTSCLDYARSPSMMVRHQIFIECLVVNSILFYFNLIE